MTPIEIDVRDYLRWMAIHNYAKTTITCRCRYLGYFVELRCRDGLRRVEDVTLELLVSYQRAFSPTASATATRSRSVPRPSVSCPWHSCSPGCGASTASRSTRRPTCSCPGLTGDSRKPP